MCRCVVVVVVIYDVVPGDVFVCLCGFVVDTTIDRNLCAIRMCAVVVCMSKVFF